MATITNTQKLNDYLEVTVDPDTPHEYHIYRIHCTKTDEYRYKYFRSRFRAQDVLEGFRDTARQVRPSNPASMTRWLLGFRMLPEHN